MKHKNCISDFATLRRRELLQRFREKLAEQSAACVKRICREAAETPASRFWVSEERAATVIYALDKGENILDGMFPERREMFLEIYRRYREMRKIYPEETVVKLVSEIVYQPAPRHFLSAERVRTLVNDEKRRNRLARSGNRHLIPDSSKAPSPTPKTNW